jgi:hypothetical protein
LKAAMAGVAARAVVIMAFGMALAYVGPGVEIILAYFGAMFLLAVPLLGLSPRVLPFLSPGFALAGPVLLQAARGGAARYRSGRHGQTAGSGRSAPAAAL